MKFNKKLLEMTGCEDFREFFVAFGEWCEMVDLEKNNKAMKDPEYILKLFIDEISI